MEKDPSCIEAAIRAAVAQAVIRLGVRGLRRTRFFATSWKPII